MSLREEQCNKVCTILDNVLANRPTERDSLIVAVRKAFKALEEPHWIPVEQDTPTEDDDYWCTFGVETGWFVDWCSWYRGQWVVWLNDEPNPVSNVIAWCKSMEPYKGVTDGRD